MWGAPEEPIVRRFRARLRRDRASQVTIGAFAVALLAAAGAYYHPDRVRTCALVEIVPGPSPCDLPRSVTLDLLLGLAVAGFAVALVATMFGLVADWRAYRATR